MNYAFTEEELKSKRIAVLYGGESAEREVSLETGKNIYEAILKLNLDAFLLDARENIFERLSAENADIVVNALHGRYGEDGCVQGALEIMKIPYTGAGVLCSAVAMDKELSRRVFTACGLPMPQGVVMKPVYENYPVPPPPFSAPLVVKPAGEGSSVGVTIVETEEGWEPAFREACRFHGSIIVEKYIKGREIQVAFLNGEIIGSVEIVPAAKFYDYEAKYLRNDTKYLVPAPIPKEVEAKIFEITLKANEVLGCEGITRSDLILDEQGGVYLLEVNTLPGMTSHSLVPMIAKKAGISFEELVLRLLRGARLKA